MRLAIDIPDWVSPDETLTLLSGQELVAFKPPRQELKIKIQRCNQCGECCLDISDKFPWGMDEEGKCPKLEKQGDKWLCTAGANKPFRCLSDPVMEGCNITYG